MQTIKQASNINSNNDIRINEGSSVFLYSLWWSCHHEIRQGNVCRGGRRSNLFHLMFFLVVLGLPCCMRAFACGKWSVS